MNLALISSF